MKTIDPKVMERFCYINISQYKSDFELYTILNILNLRDIYDTSNETKDMIKKVKLPQDLITMVEKEKTDVNKVNAIINFRRVYSNHYTDLVKRIIKYLYETNNVHIDGNVERTVIVSGDGNKTYVKGW